MTDDKVVAKKKKDVLCNNNKPRKFYELGNVSEDPQSPDDACLL